MVCASDTCLSTVEWPDGAPRERPCRCTPGAGARHHSIVRADRGGVFVPGGDKRPPPSAGGATILAPWGGGRPRKAGVPEDAVRCRAASRSPTQLRIRRYMFRMAPGLALRTARTHACSATQNQACAVQPWWGGEGSTDSPWYPPMRLFRQPRPGDWRRGNGAQSSPPKKLKESRIRFPEPP
jgi:hypothetical protein